MFINNTDIEVVQELSDDEYDQLEIRFNLLRDELASYTASVVSRTASKLPVNYIDRDDLENLCDIYSWIASYRWNGSVPLANWAKHVITSRMQLVLGSLYRSKRTPRVASDDGDITYRPESLDALPDTVAADDDDPLDVLVADNLYFLARQRLLKLDQRIAAAVLRLLVHPDLETLQLSEQVLTEKKGGRSVKITGACYARRLGVTAPRIANAKKQVKMAFMEIQNAK